MDETPNYRNRQLIAGLALLIIIVVIVAGVSIASTKDGVSNESATTSSAASTADTSPATDTSTTDSASIATYKDGIYKATASFGTPGGVNSIAVSVTVKDGIVTSTSSTTEAPERESEEYDNRFIAAYKSVVIGKNLGDINLSRVSGASLTTQAFNNALQKIETEAQA